MTREEAIKWQEAFKRTYGNFPPEATEACDMAIEALKEQKWIPVSERLPEKSNSYEVTIEYDNKQRTVIAYYSTKEHRWSTYTAFVTAWRERLPEPYKAGEQE